MSRRIRMAKILVMIQSNMVKNKSEMVQEKSLKRQVAPKLKYNNC